MLFKQVFRSKFYQYSLSSLVWLVGLVVSIINPTLVLRSEIPSSRQPEKIDRHSNFPLTFSETTHFYGQSDKPEQIDQEYLVFKLEKDRVIGAIYLPKSEFSCFWGNIDAEKMNLSIADPYDRTFHPYTIALADRSSIATTNLDRLTPIKLLGYQSIAIVDENAKRILNICLQQVY